MRFHPPRPSFLAFVPLLLLVACGGDAKNNSSSSVFGQCVETCGADEDCARTFVCDEGTCACSTDERCQIEEGWDTQGCESDDDCGDYLNTRCVEWADSTFCVPDDTTAFDCGIGARETKVTMSLADGTGTIQTCMRADRRCLVDGTCGFLECEDDGDCGTGLTAGRPHCDLETNRCVCTEDPEDSCTANHPGMQCTAGGWCGCNDDSLCYGGDGTMCILETGECGCETDEHCADGETCHEGKCSCRTDDALGCGTFFSVTNPGTWLECRPR